MIKNKENKEINMENLKHLFNLEIKCFQHCLRTERYLCFDLPNQCPACLAKLTNSKVNFRVPPFILPQALRFTDTRSNNLPIYSLLLQPTDGDYSNLVNESDVGDLHIGITNSNGEVYDFDYNGLNYGSNRWFCLPSIVINLEPVVDLNEDWDFLLKKYWRQKELKFNASSYDEFNWNCLDFVIKFLFEYGYFNIEKDSQIQKYSKYLFKLDNDNLSEKDRKNIFLIKNYLRKRLTRDLIEPEFLKCIKYLNLLVYLNQHDYFIEKL